MTGYLPGLHFDKYNGNVNSMFNYRSISLIGYITKMVEQLVRSWFVSYLGEFQKHLWALNLP